MKMELNTFVKITIISWCWSVSLTFTGGARILGIFPIPARSHFSYSVGMMRSLYNAGHEITFVSPFPNDKALKNYSVVDTSRDTTIFIGNSAINDFRISISEMTTFLRAVDTKACKNVLSSSEIQTLMNSKEKKYDVMFIEMWYLFQCYLPLAEKLKIPVIGTFPMKLLTVADFAIGNTNNPSVIPLNFNSFSDKMTFLQRLQNVLQFLYIRYKYYFDIPNALNEIYDQFYTADLLNKKQISLIFSNNHFTFLPRPMVPNMIDVAGIHVQPAKLLPQNFQKFIDEAKHGVILFSFGSVVKSSTLHSDFIIAFRDAFAEIPQRVIWKFEEPVENLSDNVLLSKWIPQRDILAHKNVKAFMSHCGIAGTYEALTEGIPMIFTPIMGDQLSNAALLEKLGVGLSLDVFSATKEKVLEALNTIINDTRYRYTMKKVSERFKDRPMSPQDTIVYWTEYVIRHNGAPYMRPIGADMPLYQYFLLDIIVLISIIMVLSFYIAAKIIKKVHHFIFKTKYKKSMLVINKKKES